MITLALLALLGVQLFFLINLQFTAWPEMLSYPYLRNEGFLLYRDMIHPYPPLLTMFLSIVYKLFGYDILVLKTVAWSVSLCSTVTLFWLVRYMSGNHRALLAAAFYILVQPFLEGNMVWFDMAIVPPVLLGTYFVMRWIKEKEDNFLVWSGLFFSLAALTKQTAALFLIALGFVVLFNGLTLKRVVRLMAGPAVLLIPLTIRLLQEGAMGDFLSWTILYPLGEWGKFPGYVQMYLTNRQLAVVLILLTPVLVLNIVRRKVFSDSSSLLLTLSLFLSMIMVYPRFSYFHFQLALVFIILNLALLVKAWDLKRVGLLFASILIILIPFVQKPVMSSDWQKEPRFYGKQDQQLGRIVATQVGEQDKIFLLGLHSGLYVMSDRLPPKRWTDNFGWYLEIPGVQEEIISRWKENPPVTILIRIPSSGNWFDLGVYQPAKLMEYIKENYVFVVEDKYYGFETWSKLIID